MPFFKPYFETRKKINQIQLMIKFQLFKSDAHRFKTIKILEKIIK